MSGKDIKRAEEKVPRGHYKGVDFAEMSDILNGWLNTSTLTKPCLDWKVEELQQLQALFYLARESQFDDIYLRTQDNRRLRGDVLSDLNTNWAGLNKITSDHSDYRYLCSSYQKVSINFTHCICKYFHAQHIFGAQKTKRLLFNVTLHAFNVLFIQN